MLFEYTAANGYREIQDYLEEAFEQAEDFDAFLRSVNFHEYCIALVGDQMGSCIVLYEAKALDKARHGFMLELRIKNTRHFYVAPRVHDAMHFIKEHRETLEALNANKPDDF